MTSSSEGCHFALAASLFLMLTFSFPTDAEAEIVYLKNGDVIRGSVTGAAKGKLTVETPYGRLAIPKEDILRIEYTEEEASREQRAETEDQKAPRPTERPAARAEAGRPELDLEIRGRSFWYAFQSPPEQPADVRIRLRLFVSDSLASTLLDSKPDTVDGSTYYNSFTFSPTDSRVVDTEEGYTCDVAEAADGRVVLELRLPEEQPEGQLLVRMRYEVNEGTVQIPRWEEAVSRAFSVPVKSGRKTHVILEQNASGLDYSGFFKKRMKNLDTFSLNVLSAVVEEPSP